MTNQWRVRIDYYVGSAHPTLQLAEAAPTGVECVFVQGSTNQWPWPRRAHVVYEFPAGKMPAVRAGVSEFAVATKYIGWLALGAITLRVHVKLLWNGDKRQFTNTDQANRYVKPALRKGWDLKV